VDTGESTRLIGERCGGSDVGDHVDRTECSEREHDRHEQPDRGGRHRPGERHGGEDEQRQRQGPRGAEALCHDPTASVDHRCQSERHRERNPEQARSTAERTFDLRDADRPRPHEEANQHERSDHRSQHWAPDLGRDRRCGGLIVHAPLCNTSLPHTTQFRNQLVRHRSQGAGR